MSEIIQKIKDANPNRDIKLFQRRMMKLGEEYGEALQAFLSVTSKKNSKKKTWDDVREELADMILVLMDLSLTLLPDEEGISEEEKMIKLEKEVDRKLKKWLERKHDINKDDYYEF